MKRYAFITSRISEMGGAENYLSSKKKWLENKGWSVILIHYCLGEVLLPNLKYGTNYIEQLKYPIYYYNKRDRCKIVNYLVDIIQNQHYDDIIIESTIIDTSTWGEVVAQNINAKHFVFSLQENNSITNESIKKYLHFKCIRNEVACINKKAAEELISFLNIDSTQANYMALAAYNSTPVEDYDIPLCSKIEAIKKDYIIGSVGRLNKLYVMSMIESIVEYVKNDSNHYYVLLLIGGGDKNICLQIERICKDVNNLCLFIVGYIYPIPMKLIQICDVMISSSGSAGVCQKQGVPTISMDGRDGMPIGVVGYTTEQHLFREQEPILPLSKYLDDILKKKIYPKTSPIQCINPSYNKHFDFLLNSSYTKEYYDVNKLKWNPSQIIQRIIMPIIGPNLYHKITHFFK